MELIAVIVVLAILSAVAVPKYVDYRDKALAARVVRDLKVLKTASVSYYIEHRAWPADEMGNVISVPGTNQNYHNVASPIGGLYNWNYFSGPNADWCIYNLGSSPSARTMAIMLDVDRQLDDGNLSTGALQWEPSSWGGTLRYFIYGG